MNNLNRKLTLIGFSAKFRKLWEETLTRFGPIDFYKSIEEAKNKKDSSSSVLTFLAVDKLDFCCDDIENLKTEGHQRIIYVGTKFGGDINLINKCKFYDWIDEINDKDFLKAKMEWYFHRISNSYHLNAQIIGNNKEPIKFTNKEEKIYSYLVGNNGSARCDEMYKFLWNKQVVTPKTLQVHLCNLRKKIKHLNQNIVLRDGGIIYLVNL